MYDSVSILDGTGNGIQAKVNNRNQIATLSNGLHQASLLGDAYAWNAISANIDTTDCCLLVCNKSATRWLVISYADVQGDIAGQIDFKLAECSGLTLAGTAVTGVCLNRAINKTADASAFADETASPAATVFYTYYQHLCVNAQTTTAPITRIEFHDSIILGNDDAIGIDTILEPAAGFEASIVGYFIDIP
jgi:hypothetical protein